MKYIKNLFITSLIFSFIFHLAMIFHDQIIIKTQLELSKNAIQAISTIEENIKKVNESLNLKDEAKEELTDLFELEKNQIKSGEEKEYLEAFYKNVKTNLDFKRFLNKTKDSEEEIIAENDLIIKNQKSKIKYIGQKERIAKTFCDDYYIGVGFTLAYKNNNFEVDIVSDNSLAKKIGLRKGDIIYGFKDSKGVFYEGNNLISKLQNKNANVSASIIYKQDDILKEKQLILEKICYEK